MPTPDKPTTATVYLEDIDPNYAKTSASDVIKDNVKDASQSTQTPSSSQNESKETNKRQRTLEDMFFSGKKSGPPAAKKVKLSETLTGESSIVSKTKIIVSPLVESSIKKLNSIPFSLAEFKESLNEEQQRLLQLECDVMGKSWLKLLKDEITKPYFISLKRFLWEEGVKSAKDTPKSCRVYPPAKDIYAWTNTPLGKIKVVILGQDPYHGPGQAHGLSFSVPAGKAVPPSLRNIYEEIKSEYPEFQAPDHGNLSAWAANGVLLLNTCLTVRAGDAGSHSNKGWEQFTDKVVDVVDRYGGANLSSDRSESSGVGRGVVFLAWGKWAAQRVAKLNKTRHLILTSAHPSPFSANRGFLGNGHFKAANEWLDRKYGVDARVDWCNLNPVA